MSEEKFKETKVKAEQGDVDAQYDLGGMYAYGIGTQMNWVYALMWLNTAKSNGHKDIAGGRELLLNAMTAKQIAAAEELASVFIGVEQTDKGLVAYRNGDYEKALTEWMLLAKQGNASAQNWLGYMHENGIGIPQDYKTAIKWQTLAAEQGHEYAQFTLGVMYEYGYGVSPDNKVAEKWYTLAAEQGHGGAQERLDVINGW